MGTAKKIRIGTLGSAATFAGEATSRMREIYPEFSEAVYFPSMDAYREFPGVPRETHGLNSVEAAKAVMAGDGTLAVVGSRSLPRMVSGLEEMGREIDDGAIASWWAVANQPVFSDEPAVLVIASRCGPDGQLGRLIGAIEDTGYLLQTAASFPVNTGVSVYDYLLTFGGKGTRSSVEKVVAHFSGTRLVGAFDKRGQEPKEWFIGLSYV